MEEIRRDCFGCAPTYQCCCGVNIQSASVAIAIFTIIWNAINFAGQFYAYYGTSYFDIVIGINLVFNLIGLISGFVGCRSSKSLSAASKFYYSYLLYVIAYIAGQVAYILIAFIYVQGESDKLHDTIEENILIAIAVQVVLAFFYIYFLYVIYSNYRIMKSGEPLLTQEGDISKDDQQKIKIQQDTQKDIQQQKL